MYVPVVDVTASLQAVPLLLLVAELFLLPPQLLPLPGHALGLLTALLGGDRGIVMNHWWVGSIPLLTQTPVKTYDQGMPRLGLVVNMPTD